MPASPQRCVINTEHSMDITQRLFVGEALIETLRIHDGHPCHTALHWQRLQDAAQQLSIPFDIDLATWQSHLSQMTTASQLLNGGIKVVLSSGTAPRGLAARSPTSQLSMNTFPASPHTMPKRLTIAPWLRDGNNPIYHIKSINYLEGIFATRYAQSLDCDDVIYLNTHRHLLETSVANIFFIKAGVLFTPPLKDGLFPGITRQIIINEAQEMGITCYEDSLDEAFMTGAQAAFLTNALYPVQPVHQINDQPFNTAHPLITQLVLANSLNDN